MSDIVQKKRPYGGWARGYYFTSLFDWRYTILFSMNDQYSTVDLFDFVDANDANQPINEMMRTGKMISQVCHFHTRSEQTDVLTYDVEKTQPLLHWVGIGKVTPGWVPQRICASKPNESKVRYLNFVHVKWCDVLGGQVVQSHIDTLVRHHATNSVRRSNDLRSIRSQRNRRPTHCIRSVWPT